MGPKSRDSFISCSKTNLFLTVCGVIIALVLSILLTFFFTKSANGNNNERSAEEIIQKDVQINVPSGKELRLPMTIRPDNYKLDVKVYLPGYITIPVEKNLTFDATVTIKLHVIERTKEIVLNYKDLNFSTESTVTANGQNIPIISIDSNERLEKVFFELEKHLEAGSVAVLKIIYNGVIGTNLGGLYQSQYTDVDGTQKIAVTTQMEPSDARRMVPCFDEPEYKANWSVSVSHPSGTTSISNGIEEHTQKFGFSLRVRFIDRIWDRKLCKLVDEDWLKTSFKTTPKMSSYLLAIIVSEFEFIEGKTATGTLFRVWSRPEAKSQTEYALKAGIKCIEYYEKFYGIRFPLEKQDMVALPDFSAGAMENWGLITYRETALLYDEKLYSPLQKRRVAVVVAHELAHQWFGNLVTMKWWNDLWLNEGFASFVEFIGTDHNSDQKFRMEETFFSDAQEQSMNADALATSHPLSFQIEKSMEVLESFDVISYDKGASIISMIRYVIGQDQFNEGIKHYLTAHSYGNAEADDLWKSLDKYVQNDTKGSNGNRLDIIDFAKQWTTQMGFPVLSISIHDNSTVKVEQSRFLVSNLTEEREKYRNPKYGYKWDVPLFYSNSENNNKTNMAWVPRDSSLFVGSSIDNPTVFNYDSLGFYRINYEPKILKKIAEQLNDNPKLFTPKTRSRLISDAFAMAEADKLDYTIVFDLTKYLEKEEEWLPWQTALTGFAKIRNYFGSEPESQYLKKFMLQRLSNIYNSSSIEHIKKNYLVDEKFFENLLEASAVSSFCSYGSADCEEKYGKHFKKEFADKCFGGNKMASQCSSVAPPLRSYIYCEGIKRGDRKTWENIFNLYRKESVQIERQALLGALTCSRDISTLKELLLITLDRKSNIVRLQDTSLVFGTMANNLLAQSFLFDFLMDRWDVIYESLKEDTSMLRKIIMSCARNTRTLREINELRQFQKDRPEANAMHVFSEQIAEGSQRIKWIETHFQNLTNYFKNSVKS